MLDKSEDLAAMAEEWELSYAEELVPESVRSYK